MQHPHHICKEICDIQDFLKLIKLCWVSRIPVIGGKVTVNNALLTVIRTLKADVENLMEVQGVHRYVNFGQVFMRRLVMLTFWSLRIKNERSYDPIRMDQNHHQRASSVNCMYNHSQHSKRPGPLQRQGATSECPYLSQAVGDAGRLTI
jgi:hypothetical protein